MTLERKFKIWFNRKVMPTHYDYRRCMHHWCWRTQVYQSFCYRHVGGR